MSATAGNPVPAELVANFRTASWIWTAEADLSNPPAGTRIFRKVYAPPAGKSPSSALVLMTVDNFFSLFVNNQLIVGSPNSTDVWQTCQIANIALTPGSNVFAVSAINLPDANSSSNFTPAGLLAAIQITFLDGTTSIFKSDPSWRASREAVPEFASPAFDDSQWSPAIAIATYGAGPWASQVSLPGAIPSINTAPAASSLPSTHSTV